MKNMTYSDVLSMPTYERRFFIKLLTKEHRRKKEEYNKMTNNSSNGSKGTRTTKISGDALKNKLSNGEIPMD
jgi:hypothetical protein